VEQQPAKPLANTAVELSTKDLRDLGCGRELGRYTLLRRIAAGGMAEVYVARSKGISGFEKKVAIKKILPQHSHNERFINMLVDEAKITVSLTHPNIAQVYELGLDGEDTYFIVMEFVDGRPLNRLMQRVDERGIMTIPLEHAVHIMSEVSKGLDHAHKQRDQRGNPLQIVHRDISPQNVLISYQGDVKLIDFGIARAEGRIAQTSHGVIKGKLRYLAPEIAAGEEPDSRADIYCCGIVLFEMLTGEAMFAPKTDLEAIEMASQARVRSPRSRNSKVPPDLDDIVMKALRRDRNERYQASKDLHTELRRFLNQNFPAFVGSELGDFMQVMFVPEIANERQLDDAAEKVAQESLDEPYEEDPTVAGTADELIHGSVREGRRHYRQLVTRLEIGSDSGVKRPRPTSGREVRLAGADGGHSMGLVLAETDRPSIEHKGDRSGSGPLKFPVTMPPQGFPSPELDRPPSLPSFDHVAPTQRAENPYFDDQKPSIVPTTRAPIRGELDGSSPSFESWSDGTDDDSSSSSISGELAVEAKEDESLKWKDPSDSADPHLSVKDAHARTASIHFEGDRVKPQLIEPTVAVEPTAPAQTTPAHTTPAALRSGRIKTPTIQVGTGAAWGYLFVFFAILIGGGSFIFAARTPNEDKDAIKIAPHNELRGSAVKEPMQIDPIKVDVPVPRKGDPASVTLRVTPTDLKIDVEVDGRQRARHDRSPIFIGDLAPERPHKIKIRAEGYVTEEMSEVLSSGQDLPLEVTLRPIAGTIIVRGAEDATIVADHGRVEGDEIVDIPLDTKVSVSVNRAGAREWTEEVRVSTTEPIELEVPPPSKLAKGALVVNSRPVSTVFINGKKKGTTPLKLKLSAGKYTVMLVGPDGEKRTLTKQVAPGKTTTMVHRW
jgi:serine/threonine protein kinase